MKEWNDIKGEFDMDGTLRDIYVEEIDLPVWNRFIDALHVSKYKIEFAHGDVKSHSLLILMK